MIKKIFLSLLICLSFGTFAINNVFADNSIYKGADCSYLLGLTSWDCGVDVKDQDSLNSGIWTVAANVATDIAVVASYIALGYVIYGGYLYMFSAGDTNKVATSKRVLPQAFIGLAITMTAHIILDTIRIVIAGGNFANCATNECVNPTDMVSNTIGWVIGVAGVISAVFVAYGGFSYITSAGEPGKLQKAKQMIIYALIGLAVVALSEIIVNFATNAIRNAGASPEGRLTNTSQIAKEVNHHEIY